MRKPNVAAAAEKSVAAPAETPVQLICLALLLAIAALTLRIASIW